MTPRGPDAPWARDPWIGRIPGRVLVALLVATPLVFVPGIDLGFNLAKTALVRVVGLGFAGLGLAMLRGRRPSLAPLDLAVLIWLGVETLATATSRAPWISLFGDRADHDGLLTSIALAGCYLGARMATRGPRPERAILEPLSLSVGVACVYALLQAAGFDLIHWRIAATYGEGAATLRPFGTLGHPNLLGVMSAMALAVEAASALAGSRWRAAHAILALVLLAATAVTLSRAAWLGAVAGLAVAVALALRARSRTRVSPRAAGGVALAALALLSVIAFSGWGRMIGARLTELASPRGESSAARVEMWRSALGMARDRPLIGQGLDTFALRFQTFQTPGFWRAERGGLPSHAHSIYMNTLATRGLAGWVAGLAWLLGLAMAGRAAWRSRPAARGEVAAVGGGIAALAVAGGFGALGVAGALSMVALSALLPALAEGQSAEAGAAVEARDAGSAASRALESRARAGWMAAATLATAAMVLGLAEIAAERASAEAYAGLQSTADAGPSRDADLRLAVARSAEGAALGPWQDLYAYMHALCALTLAREPSAPPGSLADAERAARRAVALGPLRATNWRALAEALGERAARGDDRACAEAAAAWARHHELAPCDAPALIGEADLHMACGDANAALAAVRRAESLYPDDGATLFALSGVQGALGDSLAALATLRRAVAGDWRENAALRLQAEAALERAGGGPHDPRGVHSPPR